MMQQTNQTPSLMLSADSSLNKSSLNRRYFMQAVQMLKRGLDKVGSLWLVLVTVLALTYFSVSQVNAVEAVNINTADVATLASELVGVGPEIAKRIVEFRERHGAFKSVEALVDVRGIGPALLEKNLSILTLE
jgi:competence protein ComEA|tara:strand:- start:57 stop:455 length:399 start_codon:yes stop_codon:yes gene_type:complete